jgi:hypothetical protein
MAAGTAFHAGMADIFEAAMTPPRNMGSDWHALGVLKTLWPEEAGVKIEDAARLVERAVTLAYRQEGDALLNGGYALDTELNLGGTAEEAARHGRYPGTADLVTEDADGLCVTDYKTHWKMDAKYADGELRQTARSWQLRQYAWFVQQRYDRPVTRVRKLLVAFTPALKVWLYTHPLTQQELSAWHIQAQAIWKQMDAMEKPLTQYQQAWQNAGECERYGWAWRCGHYEHCWDGAPITYEGS